MNFVLFLLRLVTLLGTVTITDILVTKVFYFTSMEALRGAQLKNIMEHVILPGCDGTFSNIPGDYRTEKW